MDERLLTEHGGSPDTEETDTFPAVAAGPAGAEPAGTAAPDSGASPASPDAAPAPASHAAPTVRTGPALHAAPAAHAAASSGWHQVPYVVALAAVIGGLVWVWQGIAQVRAGMVTVAAALLAAGLARLVLPERRAGMLASRHRLFDVVTLLGLGICVMAVAIVLPQSA